MLKLVELLRIPKHTVRVALNRTVEPKTRFFSEVEEIIKFHKISHIFTAKVCKWCVNYSVHAYNRINSRGMTQI